MRGHAKPAVVPEFFVTGVGSIEFMEGGVQRHMLVTERKIGGKVLFIPVVSLVLTTINAHEAVMTVSRALAREVVGEEENRLH